MAINSKNFDFENLFTFEMANNHQGSVAHGRRIVDEVAKVAKDFNLKSAVKLQLRNIETFIHPAYRERKDLKHIPRFISTALTKEGLKELIQCIKSRSLHTMATPFDEQSVNTLLELGVEIIKVASASARDWPLLEKIADAGRPVIVSVGGLEIKEIDKVVSFFEHRGAHFALMHCVAIYPTPPEKLYLKQIEILRSRYPSRVIGFSTHEHPQNTTAIALAYAKGARIFEKHVGLPTETIKLNDYSVNPAELRRWIVSYVEAVRSCGDHLSGRLIDEAEVKDLNSLSRGVFAAREIKAGEVIKREDVFFAMPLMSEEHMKSGEFREGLVANKDFGSGEALPAAVAARQPKKKDIVYSIVHAVKGMLNNARIPLSHDFQVEISHHHGLDKFNEVGCVIIDCINREYAKKLVIQLPDQWHPVHYHKIKDETFQILSGSMEADVEGRKRILYPGDTLWIPRGVWHGFRTESGVIFEEISTTSQDANGDSYYVDKDIAKIPRAERKTRLMNWGRHQFDEVAR